MQHYTTAPPSAAPGLDLFAVAWTERFLALAGSLLSSADGTAQMYLRVNASDVPGYEPPPEEWPAELLERRRTWEDAMFTGRTRELMDLLEMVPGGRDAVKRHIRAFPSAAYANGTKVLA